MNKLLTTSIAPVRKLVGMLVFAALTTVLSFAQTGTPSSKATAAYNSAVGCSITATSGTWTCGNVFSGRRDTCDRGQLRGGHG